MTIWHFELAAIQRGWAARNSWANQFHVVDDRIWAMPAKGLLAYGAAISKLPPCSVKESSKEWRRRRGISSAATSTRNAWRPCSIPRSGFRKSKTRGNFPSSFTTATIRRPGCAALRARFAKRNVRPSASTSRRARTRSPITSASSSFLQGDQKRHCLTRIIHFDWFALTN